MLAESRDWKIAGNTTAARYPLANALATARGVSLVSVLTAWSNAFLTAFGSLATLIRQQETAEGMIDGAETMIALRDAMATILEAIA